MPASSGAEIGPCQVEHLLLPMVRAASGPPESKPSNWVHQGEPSVQWFESSFFLSIAFAEGLIGIRARE